MRTNPSSSSTRSHNGLDILAATGAAAAGATSSVKYPVAPAHTTSSHIPIAASPARLGPVELAQPPTVRQTHRRAANGGMKRSPAEDDEDDEAAAAAAAGAHDRTDPKEQEGGRKRITRACDRCNQLRTRCTGQDPCDGCLDNNAECTYNRTKKKRGKVSARDRRRAELEAQANASTTDPSNGLVAPDLAHAALPASANEVPTQPPHHDGYTHQPGTTSRDLSFRASHPLASPTVPGPCSEGFGFGEFRNLPGFYPTGSEAGYDHFHDVHHPVAPPSVAGVPRMSTPHQRRSGSQSDSRLPPQSPAVHSVTGWLTGLNAAQSPGRFSPGRFSVPSMPSPGNAFLNLPQEPSRPHMDLKYPVLKPLIPYLHGIISAALACELLELYFASSTSAFQHPTSSHVIAYVFRKNSFLTQTRPRLCSPALLASMIWIAAQESDTAVLKNAVTSKAMICGKLGQLTINLLRPLVHRSYAAVEDPLANVINDPVLGGFGTEVNMMLPGGKHGPEPGQLEPQTIRGEIDDIATYIHLATVVSASEKKASSMRWWMTVYSLVREYHFNQELPRPQVDTPSDGSIGSPLGGSTITEETREERRRIWWLVYTVDKHLALCYNQPLNLRDCECQDLLMPVMEVCWQSGETFLGPMSPDEMRSRGVSYTMTDHSIFGFFTPLMTLLGEAIDLQQMRYRTCSQHPMPQVSEESAALIRSRVDLFLNSVRDFRSSNLPPGVDQGILPSTDLISEPHPTRPKQRAIPENHVQTIIATSYASYVARVIKVLVSGKWDPLSLLDESQWIPSEDFVTATTTAVEGAEYLSAILSFDSDLSFMPWFFGIYLLQGSFLLLLFADRLGIDVGERYTNALELSARATESCVVTLNTEYQRNFRKVMRAALSQVKGRIPIHAEETIAKRREVLGLYRWTPYGRGLAL